MAKILLSRHFTGKLLRNFRECDAQVMVCSIATIESSLQPFAYRYEAHIQEASTGLVQVGGPGQ